MAHTRFPVVCIALVFCTTISLPCKGDILNVPDDFATMQAAIDAASDGDTVLIAPGVYTGSGNRDLDTLGKAISVAGDGDPEDIVIDCQGSKAEPRRGFHIHSGETDKTIISTLTIENGYASSGSGMLITNGSSPIVQDCIIQLSANVGVAITDSSPAFIDCTIRECDWDFFGSGDGGGASVSNGNGTFVGCAFTANWADFGGGIAIANSELQITDCTFDDNSAFTAGALAILDSSVIVEDCLFTSNVAASIGTISAHNSNTTYVSCTIAGGVGEDVAGMVIGGGQATLDGCIFSGNSGQFTSAGGLLCGNAAVNIFDCDFVGNDAVAGAALTSTDATLLAVRSTFRNNTAFSGAGVRVEGGTAQFSHCSFEENEARDAAAMQVTAEAGVVVSNSLFASNAVTGVASAVSARSDSIVHMALCTIADNTSDSEDGSLIDATDSDIIISNSCIWANTPPMINGAVAITHSIVEGGFPGDGNLDLDPIFTSPATGEFSLSAGSPAIDAGDNAALPDDIFDLDNDSDTDEPVPFDLEGLARQIDDPHTDDSGLGDPPIVDMGAFEYQADGAIADLLACTITFGADPDGDGCDVANLLANDNIVEAIESRPGFTAAQPNVAEMLINGVVEANIITAVRTRDSGVLGVDISNTVSLQNFSRGSLDEFGTFEVTTGGIGNDVLHVTSIMSSDCISDANTVELRLRYVAPATFIASGFQVFLDRVQIFGE